MPDALRDRIHPMYAPSQTSPPFVRKLAAIGQAAHPGTAAEFAALLDQYRRRLADLAKTIDFKATQ